MRVFVALQAHPSVQHLRSWTSAQPWPFLLCWVFAHSAVAWVLGTLSCVGLGEAAYRLAGPLFGIVQALVLALILGRRALLWGGITAGMYLFLQLFYVKIVLGVIAFWAGLLLSVVWSPLAAGIALASGNFGEAYDRAMMPVMLVMTNGPLLLPVFIQAALLETLGARHGWRWLPLGSVGMLLVLPLLGIAAAGGMWSTAPVSRCGGLPTDFQDAPLMWQLTGAAYGFITVWAVARFHRQPVVLPTPDALSPAPVIVPAGTPLHPDRRQVMLGLAATAVVSASALVLPVRPLLRAAVGAFDPYQDWQLQPALQPLELAIRLQSAGYSSSYSSMIFGGGRFVAVGHTSTVWTVDGENWTSASAAPSLSGAKLAYGNGLFAALLLSIEPSVSTILTSPDGDEWTVAWSRAGAHLTSITFGDGRFLAVGESSVTSHDGVNWAEYERQSPGVGSYGLARPPGMIDLLWTGTEFLGVGGGAGIQGSPDGVTFALKRLPLTQDRGVYIYGFRSVAQGPDRFVVTASVRGGDHDGSILVSADGEEWQPHLTVRHVDVRVRYVRGEFIAVGSEYLKRSIDGLTWTIQRLPREMRLHDVVLGNGRLLALGSTVNPSDGSTRGGIVVELL